MKSSRVVTLVVGALLAATLLGGSPVTAANTRVVCFGTPDPNNLNCSGFNADGSLKSGILVFKPVTAGNKTFVDVLIRNDSGSTLNHVKWAAGDVADNLTYNSNPLFQPPAKPSLGGTTVAAIFPSAGCSPSTITNSISTGFLCDVGSLAAGAFVTYRVVLTPPGTGPSYHVWFTTSWNEGWSGTGSNADYAFAEGDVTIAAPTCAQGTAGYFLPNDPIGLNDGGQTCNGEKGSAASGALGNDVGGFASLGFDTPGTTPPCPNIKVSCYGVTVSVVINDSYPVPGGVQWTVTWYGIKSLSGVIHYKQNYSPSDPSTYDVIPLTKKFQCSPGGTLTTNCWVSPIIASNGNANPLFITVTFVTPNNGKAGGFF